VSTARPRPRLFAAVALVLACAPPGAARVCLAQATALHLGATERATLDNGLHVVAMEYRKLPLVAVTLLVPAGSVNDPRGEEGLASLTARLLHQGTTHRSAEAVALAVESLGAELSSSAGHDAAVMSGSFLAKDIDAGLALTAEVLLEPALDPDEARKLREQTLAAIRSIREDPSALAGRCYRQWVYGDHPYGRPVDGTSESVPRLGIDAVKRFYTEHYVAEGSVLAIVGDLPAAELVAKVRRAFTGLRRTPAIRSIAMEAPPLVAPRPVEGRPILLVDSPEAVQTHIRIGNIALARGDPDYIAAEVTGSVLGGGFTSRLIDELRVKRHLSYGAWSEFDAYRAGGDFNAGTFTKTESSLEAIDALREVLRGFATGGLAADEVVRTKAYMVGQYPERLQTADALAARLAEAAFLGLPQDDLSTWMERVGRVSEDDIERLARKYVPTDAYAMVVVGRAKELREPLAKLGTVTEVAAKNGCEGKRIGATRGVTTR